MERAPFPVAGHQNEEHGIAERPPILGFLMTHLRLPLLAILLALFLTGCSARSALPGFPSALLPDSEGFMVASFYGDPFDGRTTANGERFDKWAMTAAHKTLPFGTMLRVTNPSNARTVYVRVNDRGPFIQGRDLDLSEGAAEELGMVREGVRLLEVRVLESYLADYSMVTGGSRAPRAPSKNLEGG